MDSHPQSQEKPREINRLDSVYELKYEIPKPAETDDVSSSKDKVPPSINYNSVYDLVANDSKACLNFLRSLKLEFIGFVYMFSYIMRSVSSTTMIIEKVCIVHLGYSEDLCSHLEKNMTIKTEVEKLANYYHLLHTMVQIIPSAFLACFIGPWSDRYSRKIPIILALIGIILDGFGAIICAYYKYSGPEYYSVSAIFTGISGGFVSVLTIIYSCASDTTATKDRTFKYTLLELSFGLGMPLGQLAGGWIYKYSGYVYVFATSVAGHCLGLIWVIFVMEETRGLDNKEPLVVKLKSFFTVESMMDSFRAGLKKRPNRVRLQIWLLVLSMCVTILNFAAAGGISYLFTYHQYNWDNTKYSTVSAVFSVIGMVAILASVPLLTKMLKVKDATLGIIGSLSVIGKDITTSFAKAEGWYYLAQLFGLFSAMANLAGRSRISKIVPKDDLGKVFSFVSITESVFPIIGSAVFSLVFNASLSMGFPGLSFLILGLLMVIALLIFIWFAFLPVVNYDTLQEEVVHEEKVEISEIS